MMGVDTLWQVQFLAAGFLTLHRSNHIYRHTDTHWESGIHLGPFYPWHQPCHDKRVCFDLLLGAAEVRAGGEQQGSSMSARASWPAGKETSPQCVMKPANMAQKAVGESLASELDFCHVLRRMAGRACSPEKEPPMAGRPQRLKVRNFSGNNSLADFVRLFRVLVIIPGHRAQPFLGIWPQGICQHFSITQKQNKVSHGCVDEAYSSWSLGQPNRTSR